MGRLIDLTGQRFGKLVVKEFSGRSTQGSQWLCVCDCGNTTTATCGGLRSGHPKSCGCLVKRHGMFGTRIYDIWASMHKRCKGTSGNHHSRRYHGRGIVVCDEWRKFEAFYGWAKENGYDDSLTIDRIDNDGNYEPTNCRWASAVEQANNRTTNKLITLKGETKTCSQWEEKLGFRKGTISERITKRGLTETEALSNPIKAKYHIETFNGESRTLTEWAAIYNLPAGLVGMRILRGWNIEKALFTPVRGKK